MLTTLFSIQDQSNSSYDTFVIFELSDCFCLLPPPPPPPPHTQSLCLSLPLSLSPLSSLSLSLYISPLFAPLPLFRSFFSLSFSHSLYSFLLFPPLSLYPSSASSLSPISLSFLCPLSFSIHFLCPLSCSIHFLCPLSISIHFLCPLSLSQISFHPPPFCPQCCGNNPVYCGTENLPVWLYSSHSISCCENHPSFTPELLRFQNFYLRSFHKEEILCLHFLFGFTTLNRFWLLSPSYLYFFYKSLKF